MSEKLWIGGIYLKEEGGYEIILKSLIHYRKRLQTIHESPELKEAAAMFAPLLKSTAMKKIPSIAKAKEKGVYKGRKPTVDNDKIRELASQGLQKTAIAKELGIGRATVYRALEV